MAMLPRILCIAYRVPYIPVLRIISNKFVELDLELLRLKYVRLVFF